MKTLKSSDRIVAEKVLYESEMPLMGILDNVSEQSSPSTARGAD